ncbi:MAG: pirin family protein [Sandaracinaceae bacterium]|nr:pirin family protein [Sandaracinaceae bacterium]
MEPRDSLTLKTFPIGPSTSVAPWPAIDPFLFCVHHADAYPKGNDAMGPAASLAGRHLGQDFEGRDGWRMYHGEEIPGFPQHPHRGFETVTIARKGFIDHSDSLGAAARFGKGDAQWLTAGAGIVHSEMFPLLAKDAPNPAELFQLWLNLPRASKMAKPYFSMFWADTIPRHTHLDAQGHSSEVTIVAGRFGEIVPPAPPPDSWAARPEANVAIWTVRMDAGATLALPASEGEETLRTLYLFRGPSLTLSETDGARTSALPSRHGAVVMADHTLVLEAGAEETEVLVLQGRPIGEPVVAHGPFVMNTREEIQRTFQDYQRTRFGGWPWKDDGPVHGRDEGRFARHPDGRVEKRPA